MSNIGKRIKSVILKGKSFWNWKNESNINVALPNPKDYRNKISYDTNVELIFNREAIVTKVYSDPKQIPALETLIPQGYKLLYPSNNTIQVYNNNRFVLVYDYYDLIVHYRDESNPNVDISIFKGRYQYGTLITANMINWPAGREGKDDWIEFPIGELTPARVTDRYVYLPSGTSTPETTPEDMKHNTVIEMTINHTGKEYISRSSVTFIPGYIDYRYIDKYLYGRLPIGVKTNYSFKISKGSVNNIEIGGYSDRLPEIPKAYYVGANNNITKVNYTKNGSSAQRFNVVPIIWYDKKDPLFEKFYDNNPSDIKPFFDKYLSNMIAEYITGHRVPNGTYGRPFESNNKMNTIIPSFKVFKTENNTPFIYMINKTVFDKNFNPNETKAVFNIGEVLTKVESENTDYKDYFRTRCFTIDVDRVDDNFTYTAIENFTLNGQTADLLCYLVPLDRISYIGLYTNKEKMYKHYFSSVYKENPVIDSNIASSVPANTSGGISVFGGVKKTGYKELKNPVGPVTYEEYKSSNGDRISFASGEYTTKYKHTHNTISTKAELIRNEQSFLNNQVIDETSILIESRKEGNSGNISEDTKQKYRIHFFNEHGLEMKEYLTDQWIKEGSAPSPYPPRGYIIDPDKPWTRNPNDNKEIYVYLTKKICRVIVQVKVINPSNIKNKYWNTILGDNILLDTSTYVGEKINPHALLERFKNTHITKLKSVQIEDSVYNSMAELEIEDSITITFNFKVFKKDSILSVLKLSEARKEFGIINPYFDYSLSAILVKKEALKSMDEFEREGKTRTNNLVRAKSDISNIHLNKLEGCIETDIVYSEKINNVWDYTIENTLVGIKVYVVKDGIKTLKFESSGTKLNELKLENSLRNPFTKNRTLVTKYDETVSNIAEFLIDDINNINDRDIFRIMYANSPDFIKENIDLEVEIEWEDDLLNYRYNNKYAIDIRLIPSALIPIRIYIGYDRSFLRKKIKKVDSSYGLSEVDIDYNDLHRIGNDLLYTDNKLAYEKSLTRKYIDTNDRVRELIKATNAEIAAGTAEFKIRPWSARQILPRPIPIFTIDGNLMSKDTNTIFHVNDIKYILTQINKDRSKVFNNKVISNCITEESTEPDDDNILSNDTTALYPVPYRGKKDILNNVIYKIDHPKLRDIILYHTQAGESNGTGITGGVDPAYGTTSIEDWFKIMIEYPSLPLDTHFIRYVDTFVYIASNIESYNDKLRLIPEVYANPKGYKPVDFSYVKQDTEHSYINTIIYEPIDRERYIFHPTPSNVDTLNASIIRNYLEDGRVMRTYLSETNDILKVVENSAYKGYLEGKAKFVDFVASEIICVSKLYDHKEFYFISAGLYESKQDALKTNQENNRYYTVGDIFDTYKNQKGYKDLVDKGEIVKYPANKDVFDKDSVIKLIYSGKNYHSISDIRHLKWHAIEEDNPTVVLDFERKYALDFATPYSRNIIIPDLDKLVDYAFDRDNTRFLISDSSTWMEPVMWICGDNNEGSNDLINYIDRRPQKLNSNRIYIIYTLSNEIYQTTYPSSNYPINDLASRLYYALLIHDIYNNKKDDGYAIRQELYNPDDIIKYKYIRYPDNDAIDKFVNIHMYNNTVVSIDGETAVHLKASRYDYRFHPNSIHIKIFGYNIYDLLFKATSIVDLHSNNPNIEIYANDKNADYNIVYRWKLDNDVAAIEGRRFNYSIGLSLTDEFNTIRETPKAAYIKDTTKQIYTIAPNIYHNFGMTYVRQYDLYINTGDIYRPLMFNDEDIQGLNFKNSPVNTFYTSKNRTFVNHSTNNDKYKLINPYALLERNNGTSTGITFEDVFRKAWDPYTGHRFTGRSTLAGNLNYIYITNQFDHYADPYNITTNWMLRVSKNAIHFGGAWNDDRLVSNPSLIRNSLNLLEYGIPQDPISAGTERYKSGLNDKDPTIINQWLINGNAVSEHPMNIRYVCHPFQRTCLILIRLVTDNPAAANTNVNTINLPVYMGYVNIRYEEIDKRKNDPTALKAYIKECALREDSGYGYYLKNFKYPYTYNVHTQHLFKFDVVENDPLDIIVTYTENHSDTNPSYQFSAEFVLRAHIIGEDVRKPANADICDTKALLSDGNNAIIRYIIDLKQNGAIRNKLGNNNLSNEEFYDAIKFLSNHSLEKIDAAPKYGIPEYFVHKYSIFNGVKRFGWSAYNGQYLPKWPVFIPDNVTMLVSQNLLLIKDSINVNSLSYNRAIKPLRLLNTNMMLHPNFTGGIKDKNNEYVNFDNTKFYGSINIADVSEYQEFTEVNPKLTGFEYYSNRIYDDQRPGKETANYTLTQSSGMALQSYYIRYAIDTITGGSSKWFKQKAYEQMHDVFMHKEEYAKSTIHGSVPASTTPQEYLNKVYDTLMQPSLYSRGVSNFNLWDDNSSIGFRMDLNPVSVNIVYPNGRYAPTAIQWNFPMIFRRDARVDFYRQREYWTALKNYTINEIAFNPHNASFAISSFNPWI